MFPSKLNRLANLTRDCKLGITSGFADVTVAGYHHDIRISPKNSHFSDINLLGSTFLALRDIALLYNGRDKSVDVVFDWRKNWSKIPGAIIELANVEERIDCRDSLSRVNTECWNCGNNIFLCFLCCTECSLSYGMFRVSHSFDSRSMSHLFDSTGL
jgi:hypothetical protein